MNAVIVCAMKNNTEALELLRRALKGSLRARLGTAREDLHYSQSDVLEELERYGLGRTQGSISQLENGIRLPSVEALYVLAKYLETSTDYLLGLTDNAASVADMEEIIAAASGQSKLDRLTESLTKEQRQQVVLFAEYLQAQNEPPTPAQMRANIVAMLESIEKERGLAARQEFERGLRELGLSWNRGQP